MTRRVPVLLCTLVLLSPFLAVAVLPSCSSADSPSQAETYVLREWDGDNMIAMTEMLCNISANHTAYRVSGSEGANETADLIAETLEGYGLSVHEENFELPIWNLGSEASLCVDEDGDRSTSDDTFPMISFNADAYSWPTAENGSFGGLVTLPLPVANSRSDTGRNPINETAWNEVNTTGRILIIGREIRWDYSWETKFIEKISAETPEAIIFHFSYDWMNYTEDHSQSSTGGRPLSYHGSYFWNLEIAIGSVNYSDGRALESLAQNGSKVLMDIPAIISEGTHRNIIADIPASSGSQLVLIGAHYDTVMCEGYIDNTASIGALLEAARVLQAAKDDGVLEPTYGIRFVAFAGEELGLVGSLNYVNVHRNELSDHMAVIVADCIGARDLKVTDPVSAGGISLGPLVSKAVTTLNASYDEEALDGSDHMSFMYPQVIAGNVNDYWGTDWDLNGVGRFSNAMLFYSYPMTIYDGDGTDPGHIHTSSDSIDDAQGGWIYDDDIKTQAQVIALTVLYAVMSEDGDDPGEWAIYLVPSVIIVATVIIFCYLFRPWR
ncbi:MAG: M28 family peptidase [Methanomassiliicoccales archaeon]|nr:M28 family peptidase [Methanomassiliicoccales archaeon]